jgi:outer membrane protein assembly factor BamB
MTWRRNSATVLLALVIVLGMTGCPKKPPATPGAPWGAESTWTYSTYTCSVVTTISGGSIRYIMDWQDAIDTTDIDFPYASNETVGVTHVWDAVGTYDVKAKACRADDATKASDFSPALSVRVILNQRPVVDSVLVPPVAVKGAPTNITVYGHDDDGDSLRAVVKWPSGDTTTEFTPTPCMFTVSNVFSKVEDAEIHVQVQDWKKAKSLDTVIHVTVQLEGGVKWWWQDNVEESGMLTSALVANNGADEVVMSNCWGDWTFYSLTTASAKVKAKATTRWPEYDFSGDPALCNLTGHVIVGSDEGELYALTLSGLSRAWRWPDVDESLDLGITFGAPAISGTDIYVGRDEDVDSLCRIYKFSDLGSSVSKVADYVVGANQSMVDAPAIDADGSVYFGTDSGTLVKLDADLNPYWRLQLETIGEVNGPIIGSDGTVYCGTDSFRFYAVNSDGTIKWTRELTGIGARPALGQSALFVGTDQGVMYSLNPSTGSVNWEKTISTGGSFNTTPIVAANGYVYFQSDLDVLYCMNQADGTEIWACDCNYYLPYGGRSGGSHRAKVAQLVGNDPNPSITSTGDIIVVGGAALFCVAGYEAGPLDTSAPWPKWQKDLWNTGKK